jgi:hypothetical protein
VGSRDRCQLPGLRAHKHWVTSLTVLAGGRRALSGSEDRTLRLWDLETGAEWGGLTFDAVTTATSGPSEGQMQRTFCMTQRSAGAKSLFPTTHRAPEGQVMCSRPVATQHFGAIARHDGVFQDSRIRSSSAPPLPFSSKADGVLSSPAWTGTHVSGACRSPCTRCIDAPSAVHGNTRRCPPNRGVGR